ncbi:transcriptional regulator [Mycobacteroides abscessus subsp. abscessus]|nr:transcriptional regulator [Mycobacteroides abscessus subsp. abscessus]SKK09054.1 transcriptional regulator [Mycobacteroides abscessus subsp. bolletii]SHX41772.1 transcriptional regulator [Mycobacteroides abscessus subsp. abscessus]SIG57565.1 transcriptional regulator [Mycobacteroides abscessus subsp. abscessus]SKD16140.1 transcriptional regulator [Mycobacteroides abscessus subsp. abscessus]
MRCGHLSLSRRWFWLWHKQADNQHCSAASIYYGLVDSLRRSVLSGTHGADMPTLPRGRGRLPENVIKEAQYRRMLRATVSAIDEIGYAEVTVADIVTRARVSRKVFYEHFGNKKDCFLATVQDGAELIFERVVAGAQDAEPGDELRGAMRAYLRLVAEEPEFIRCFGIELYAAGDDGLRLRQEAYKRYAALLRALVNGTPVGNDLEPAELGSRDRAVIAALTELVVANSLNGMIEKMPELEDDLVFIVRALYRDDV